jgi:rare lipoprotein A
VITRTRPATQVHLASGGSPYYIGHSSERIMMRYVAMLTAAASLLVVSSGFAEPPAAGTARATASTGSAMNGATESGLAAVYSDKLAGRRTASGQLYDPSKFTAAHKTLPFGTHVKVTNPKNGKSVVVRINDRGPMQAGRILDLSPRAAHALGIRRLAMAEVSAEVQN